MSKFVISNDELLSIAKEHNLLTLCNRKDRRELCKLNNGKQPFEPFCELIFLYSPEYNTKEEVVKLLSVYNDKGSI